MNTSLYHYRERPAQQPDAPTLALFHGTGADENQFFELGASLAPQARVVAVRGDVSENGMLRYFKRSGEGVYDMDDLAARIDKMASFLTALAPEGPLYGFGFSNGANIIATTMIAHPALFDAAAMLHPLIPYAPEAAPGLAGRRALITGGRADPICPPDGTQALADYFTRQGMDVDMVWHEGGHEVRREELVAAQTLFQA